MSETAENLRTEARESYARAEESFQRSDTDGFLSQWASNITGTLKMRQADVEENGGRWEFPAIFDLDGNLVAAVLIPTRYGYSWGLLADESNPRSRMLGFFNPSKHSDPAKRRAANARKGYYVGAVKAPAEAKIVGSGTGLAGAASCYVAIVRRGPFTRDVEIVDNGQENSGE